MVVVVGESVLMVPVPAGSHAYEAAPDTLTVCELPLQMVVLVVDAATVGVAVMVMFLTAVLVPVALVTVKLIVFTPAVV